MIGEHRELVREHGCTVREHRRAVREPWPRFVNLGIRLVYNGARFVYTGARFVNPGTRFVNLGIRLVYTGARFVNAGARFVNRGIRFVFTGALFVNNGGTYVKPGGELSGAVSIGVSCAGTVRVGRTRGGPELEVCPGRFKTMIALSHRQKDTPRILLVFIAGQCSSRPNLSLLSVLPFENSRQAPFLSSGRPIAVN